MAWVDQLYEYERVGEHRWVAGVEERDIQLVPVGNRDMYEELADPAGPANNAQPCRICSEPIAKTAHPTHRTRHVCSPRCNNLLKRRHKRAIAREKQRSEPSPELAIAPEDALRYEAALTGGNRAPRVFRTVTSDDGFPYEFGRGAPIVGDVVERDGSTTRYLAGDLTFGVEGEVADGLFLAYNDDTGSAIVLGSLPDTSVSPYSYWTHLHHRVFFPAREPIRLYEQFEHDERSWVWSTEIIRDVDADGNDYTWRAIVCTREPRTTLWAPAYQERSQRYERTSRAANSAAARAREFGVEITIERVDPWDIYQRDGWTCQLCALPVDKDVAWPHPQSVTLDHTHPIARGGHHVASNLQTAHWQCNALKGDRPTNDFPG